MTDLVKEARKRGWTTDIERHTALMMLGGEEPVGTRTLVRDVIDRLCAERDRMESVAIRLASRLEALEAAQQWRPIADAPRSVSVDTPHGKHVTGKYLLGFCPDEAIDPNGCIDAIWWEPNENKGRGAWFGAGAMEVRPTHFMPLPLPPQQENRSNDE